MPTYRLSPPPASPARAPALDASQRAVVDHDCGPLLVLAGPGTGKTTTLVEAAVERVENRGVPPESILMLTFSRKAAQQLRDRVTARLGRTLSTTIASTFHSFAYGLVRSHHDADPDLEPPRLLSAAQQDVRLRELLGHPSGLGRRHPWPEGLRGALGTRGFGRELQAVIGRARGLGLEPDGLMDLAEREGRSDWLAAGSFMEEYLHVMDLDGAMDYTELIHRASVLVRRPDVRKALRSRYSWVLVDEYQDTDRGQQAILQALAGDGRNLVAVGDPDQSIYAFRGAEVRGILDFPEQFRTATGARARVVALRGARRFGTTLVAASRRIAEGIPVSGAVDLPMLRGFRDLAPAPTGPGDGRVEARLFTTTRAETDHIADILRRAHLEEGVQWSEMAVLVRSGRASIPRLRRALLAAGVPVEVAGDEIPLAREPSVAPLLDCLAASVTLDRLGAEQALRLLSSPLGGLDAADIRTLGRALRARQTRAGQGRQGWSGDLVRDALLDPENLESVPGRPAAEAAGLGRLLALAAAQLAQGGSAEEVLWTLWAGTSWPLRLRASVGRGGPAARLAHRDLDAICALFDVAARAEEKRGHTSVETLLEELLAQQIPADSLAERGVREDSVRLLTAHRAKGLQWRLVIAAGVQEGSWPGLRRRGSLLEADRVSTDGQLPPTTTSMVLAEERRLFYVAATRARERFVATAVQSTEEDGDQPSRFLAELGVEVGPPQGRPSRPLTLSGLVADLRRAAGDSSNPSLQRAAAVRLARLALTRRHGEPVAPAADPANWWGTRRPSRSATPLRDQAGPITVSAGALEGITRCPARWFLEREAGAGATQSLSRGLGMVLHVLADQLAKGGLDDPAEMIAHADGVWDQLVFETPWARERQRSEVRDAVRRLVRWHLERPGRSCVASEQPIEATVTLPDGQEVILSGIVDRLELDQDGRLVVVDFKTSKNPSPRDRVRENAQLGLYQLAVDQGGADHLVGRPARSGGAELVQLRIDDAGFPKVQAQGAQRPDAEGGRLVERQLARAAGLLRSEEITASVNDYCDQCDFHATCPVMGSGTVLS